MKLKEKTHRKFVDFFEKLSRMYQGKEFELAYSDIQRETGTASVTLKRAIQSLSEDGVIQVAAGRNSRYAKFKFLLNKQEENHEKNVEQDNNQTEYRSQPVETTMPEMIEGTGKKEIPSLSLEIQELTHIVNHLLRRVRNQEMTIALCQDRLAELEDKMYKK